MAKFLLGLIIGLLILPAWAFFYLHVGHPPVAVADKPFPFEKQIVRMPLAARIDKEMPATAPIQPSPDTLIAGAQIYRQQCASCHGLYGRPSDFANHMYPHAPQLWAPHHNGIVGVSDDPVGETWWKVANGIRLTGMPSFDKVLNQTQMWQVSLLLQQADKPLPPEAMNLLKQPLDAAPAQ
jgi:mono/diheme cytochrome c family protein